MAASVPSTGPPPAPSPSFIWFNYNGQIGKVPRGDDVAACQVAIHGLLPHSLGHCDATAIQLFAAVRGDGAGGAAGGGPTFATEQQFLDAVQGDRLDAMATTIPSFVIVVAPPPPTAGSGVPAGGGAAAPTPAVVAHEVTAADLVSVPDLPPVLCETSPPFIPQTWPTIACEGILPRIRAPDFAAGALPVPGVERRIAPTALVRCSRGGKTRALREVGRHLYDADIDGRPLRVMFVSFNDATPYERGEASSPLESLLARIAYAALRPERREAIGALHQEGALRIAVRERDIVTWLATHPCVLLIDELNKVDGVDGEAGRVLGRFLRTHFLTTAGRYFIFSSHVCATTLQVSRFLTWPSDRAVRLQPMPRFETIAHVNALVSSVPAPAGAAHREAVLAFGNLPALAYSVWNRDVVISSRVNGVIGAHGLVVNEALMQLVVRDVLGVDPVPACIPSADLLATYDQDNQRLWVPVFLEELFRRAPDPYPIVATFLHELQSFDFGDGKAWEAVVVCALLLRCLLVRDNEPMRRPSSQAIPRVRGRGPINVRIHRSGQETVDHCLAHFRRDVSVPTLDVVWPTFARFPTYDAFVVYRAPGQERVVFGYQMKDGEGPVTARPHVLVARSFIIRGVNRTVEEPAGWTPFSSGFRDAFLGPTFAVLAPYHRPLPARGPSATGDPVAVRGSRRRARSRSDPHPARDPLPSPRDGITPASDGADVPDGDRVVPSATRRPIVGSTAPNASLPPPLHSIGAGAGSRASRNSTGGAGRDGDAGSAARPGDQPPPRKRSRVAPLT